MFVLFYYKQVLGLSGTLTGLAIFVSVIWDAISDPLVGAWSDRMQSRWGRRHPLMLAAVLPMALSFVALFSPPEVMRSDQTLLFCWLLASVLALRTSLTVFVVPWLALGAEISTDYHQRTLLAAARTHIGWFVGVLIPATSLAFLFSPSGDTDGRFVLQHYVSYGLLCATGVIIASVLCLRGTWHHIPMLPRPQTSERSLFAGIVEVFRNFNFRLLVLLDIAVGGMGGIVGALLMVTFTYFWELSTAQISVMFAGPPLLAVLVSTMINRFWSHRLQKQHMLQLCCIVFALNLTWLTPLKLLGWVPDEQLLFLLIFTQYAIHTCCIILRTISSHALLADIADEQELQSGERQEGVMFAAAFFAAKFITAFGYLVGGPFLDIIGLESGAIPGQTPANVELGLGLMMGPALALMMLIPVWASFRLRLSRENSEHIRLQLEQHRGAGVTVN